MQDEGPSMQSEAKGGSESLEEKIARVMRGISIVSYSSKGYQNNSIATVNAKPKESEPIVKLPDSTELSGNNEIIDPIETNMKQADVVDTTLVALDSSLLKPSPAVSLDAAMSTPTRDSSVPRELVSTSMRKPVNLAPGTWSLGSADNSLAIRNTVTIRVRPTACTDKQHLVSRNVLVNSEGKLVIVNPRIFETDPHFVAETALPLHLNEWAKSFHFDHVLWSGADGQVEVEATDQIDVYRAMGCDIVERVLSGNSVLCFSYGQSGSGKSYSMFGDDYVVTSKPSLSVDDDGDDDSVSGSVEESPANSLMLSDRSGLVPRVVNDIVDGLKQRDGCCDDTKISLSFLEIHNEKVHDLLNVSNSDSKIETLRIREHPNDGPYVEGLLKVDIQSSMEALNCIRHGLTRSEGRNGRTHKVIMLELSPKDLSVGSAAKKRPNKRQISASKPESKVANSTSNYVRLYMVDLAASVRDPLANSEVEGVKLGNPRKGVPQKHDNPDKTELKLIRRSLSTLGYIIKAIAKGSPVTGLPYRDSVLTWLLKDSLVSRTHISILATLSASHLCYEESMNTLKFADQIFQSWGGHRRLFIEGDGVESSTHDSTTRVAPGAKHFSHIQSGLGADRPGSQASKQLLKQTINDPQQRIAKYKQTLDGKIVDQRVGSSDLMSAKEAEEIRNSYRVLQGQFVEMQIELDTARTDRDSFMIELKQSREILGNLQLADTSVKKPILDSGVNNNTAKDISDLKAIISRKEDMIEKLLADLTDEKKKHIRIVQIQESQNADYLAKTEKLQNDLLATIAEIKELRKLSASQIKENEQTLAEFDKLRATYDEVNQRLTRCQDDMLRSGNINQSLQREINSIKYAYNTMEASFREQTLELDKQRVEIEALSSERDSLLTNAQQQKSMLALQSQQTEEALKMQWQRQETLERVEKDAEFSISQLMSIQDGLQKLFAREGTLIHSELVDAKKLTGMLTLVRDRMLEVNNIRLELERERSMRIQLQDIQQRQDSAKLSIPIDPLNDVNEQLAKYRKLAEASEAKANYWQTVAQQRVKDGVGGVITSPPNSSSIHNLNLKEENERLRSQLASALADAAMANATLEKSQESMQREFSSLWIAVQELNKLDAAKEKALAELISDRDRVVVEKNNATTNLMDLSRKYQQLQQDLEAIDRDLLEAAEAERIEFPTQSTYAVLGQNSTRQPEENSYNSSIAVKKAPRHISGISAAPRSPLIETVVQNQIAELSGFLSDDRARHSSQQRRFQERTLGNRAGAHR